MSMLFGGGSDEDGVDHEKVESINWNDHTTYKTLEEKILFVSLVLNKNGMLIKEILLFPEAYEQVKHSLGGKFIGCIPGVYGNIKLTEVKK